jgi:hypothetical protein
MGSFQFLFYYTIKNGQLCDSEKYISINEDDLEINGIKRDRIFQDNILRPFVWKIALYITFRGNQYGSETLTMDVLISQLKNCCTPAPLYQRIHSTEHAIEFN